jgi:hypothetical protein
MIEKITSSNLTLAIIVRSNYSSEGITFFTDDNFSQQLGYMNRPKGYSILPHRHNIVSREVVSTQEVLFIKSGKIRVDFYDNNQKYLESRTLFSNDVILLADGGHGFEMLEPSEIIEVKQGPYVGEIDKVRFEKVENKNINLK